MAERNADAGRGDGPDPVNEDAVWAAIVSGYGEEPADPDLGAEPNGDRDGESRKPDPGDDRDSDLRQDSAPLQDTDAGDNDADTGPRSSGPSAPADRPLGSSITVYAAGIGPRDWGSPEPSGDDPDGGDGGHFVPPEPPPLPQADATAKFAWLAVLGGPLLLLLAVLFQWQVTWWIGTLGIGGFLGGFGTLVFRMKDSDDDDEFDDPGRGAVV